MKRDIAEKFHITKPIKAKEKEIRSRTKNSPSHSRNLFKQWKTLKSNR
jgi:hypothetical protein